MFVTLEDETGWVNLVIWPKVYEQHALVARTAKLMGVTGKMQVKDGTHHLIVDTIWEPEVAAKLPKSSKSRDFR
jgi:error-prone DNA polymerase